MKQLYRSAFKEHGRSPKAVLFPKGNLNLRFQVLTSHFRKEGFSVLDFGCGLGHLKEYLDSCHRNYTYMGVDIIEEFIAENKKTLAEASDTLFCTIKGPKDIQSKYDHIVISGVFNILTKENDTEQQRYIQEVLAELFKKTNHSLSVNFMDTRVDYRQKGAYHQCPETIYAFASSLSKRVVLDHSYMPYEYTLKIYKNQNIVGGNVYERLDGEDC